MLGLSAGNLQTKENIESEIRQIIMSASTDEHSMINLSNNLTTYSMHNNSSDFCWLSVGTSVNINMLRNNYIRAVPMHPNNTTFYQPSMSQNVYYNYPPPLMSISTPIPTMVFINNSQKNAYQPSSPMTKTSVHGNSGHSIASGGHKKHASATASGKSSGKHQPKQQRAGVNKRADKNYDHTWLMTTLKGHTDQVYDIDFSSNGKYLASCSEATSMQDSGEVDVCDDTTGNSSSSSSEDSPKQIRQQSTITRNGRPMSRRQRKNRKSLLSNAANCSTTTINEKENQEPCANNNNNNHNQHKSKAPSSSSSSLAKKRPSALPEIHRLRTLAPPLREHIKLNLPENVLADYLKRYTLTPSELVDMGFPYILGNTGKTAIFRRGFDYASAAYTFDVNAREFVPKYNQRRFQKKQIVIINHDDGLDEVRFIDDGCNNLSGDSGQESGTSSPPSGDSDTNDFADVEIVYQTTMGNTPCQIKLGQPDITKQCMRCYKKFDVTDEGGYVEMEQCIYHWGKKEQVFNNGKSVFMYSCCGKESKSEGCSIGDQHVWSGVKDGFNGPYQGYVKTQPAQYRPIDGNYGVYALDCEMSFTSFGLELTKASLVKSTGELVYETLVKPTAKIIDYNTRFSGITEKDLSARDGSVKTLEEVQNDLLQIISAETILIGHGLENDFRALKIIHSSVIDTSHLFPHVRGLPYRRSLKSITKSILKRDIQNTENPHCSFEDSRASLELLLWLVRNEIQK